MSDLGYSQRPLVGKLGIKPGAAIKLVNAPATFGAKLGRLPAGAVLGKRAGNSSEGAQFQTIIAFARGRAAIERGLPQWKRALAADASLWLCWPKRASGVTTDLTENVLRGIGLASGLVDVKVCAIDETWSGLKFVYRLKDRPAIGKARAC